MLFLVAVCASALLMDFVLGEPKRWHPLIGFAHYAQFWERKLYSDNATHMSAFIRGLICWSMSVLVPVAFFIFLAQCVKPEEISESEYWTEFTWLVIEFCLSVLVLYLAIGQNSLAKHAMAVYQPLLNDDIDQARRELGMIVSRDTQSLNETEITTATVETVIENTHDAVIGPLFWFLALGIPGVILFRLANTLDAMWGYKTKQYEFFGKTAARMDDLLGFFSARLTVLLFAFRHPRALKGAWVYGRKWYSPNAGPVMSAGAGALNVQLGGNAQYNGEIKQRNLLYDGKPITLNDIKRSAHLMYFASATFALILLSVSFLLPE